MTKLFILPSFFLLMFPTTLFASDADWKGWTFGCGIYNQFRQGGEEKTKLWAQRSLNVDQNYVLTLEYFDDLKCEENSWSGCRSWKIRGRYATLNVHFESEEELEGFGWDEKAKLLLLPKKATISGQDKVKWSEYIFQSWFYHRDPLDPRDPLRLSEPTFSPTKGYEAHLSSIHGPKNTRRSGWISLESFKEHTGLAFGFTADGGIEIEWVDRTALKDVSEIEEAYSSFCDLDFFFGE